VTPAATASPLPTKSQLQRWESTHLTDAASQWRSSATQSEDLFDQHRATVAAPGGTEWGGEAKDAALQRAATDLAVVRQQSALQRGGADIAEQGAGDVRAAQRAALDAIREAEANGFIVSEDLSVNDTRTSDPDTAVARHTAATEHAEDIRWNAERLVQTDGLVGRQLAQKVSELQGIRFDGEGDATKDGIIQAVDFKQGPPGQAESEANRRQNEKDAFKEVFGREPASSADWTTAAALDPHSYDPNVQGVAPEIRVTRIAPVPGQGVVRASQWIEQRDVISGPFTRDFGNGRVADPHFDPADSKVTTYIDYENGLVVVRQNPSIELNDTGGPGQVKVGVPEAVVQQSSDGAVRIKYDAANPFAPEIAQNPPWPLADNPWTVNGDLVFTPTADGVHVDGTRTNYPSMETYQDLPNGSTRTILIDPAIAGNSTGPMVNLPEHHDVGIGGRAFAPFDTGAWNPKYDVQIPLPSTEAGPVTTPPVVPQAPRQGTQV
jgi:hypothetical protein